MNHAQLHSYLSLHGHYEMVLYCRARELIQCIRSNVRCHFLGAFLLYSFLHSVTKDITTTKKTYLFL